ncbi:hypothetical protein A5681_10140 [Mycobacterium scrofulaceum]|nr:hypothetical protein A5681_10140 [Mycobacterium scrofulaceum]
MRVDGQVELVEAKLRNGNGNALILHGAEIAGAVLANRCEVDGALWGPHAHIGGQVELVEAKLRNGNGNALILDSAEIKRSLIASCFEVDGVIWAPRAHIGGVLDLREAKLRNADGNALVLDGAHIAGGMFANGCEADGTLRAMRAHIGGALELNEAKLRNGNGQALLLDGAQIRGDVLAIGCEAHGEFSAVSVDISGGLALSRAKLRNGDDNALKLDASSMRLLKIQDVDVEGTVRLYKTEIGNLVTDANPPAPLVATGWQVSDVDGPLRSNWAAARRWLGKTDESSAQPLHALAAVYERNGDPVGARRLRFAAATKVTRQSRIPTRILRSLYGALVGHGYYPLLAGFWLAIVVLVATIIVAANRADFVPTNRDAAAKAALAYAEQTHRSVPQRITAQESCDLRLDYPCLNPFTYTMSAVAPNFGNMTSDWAIPSDATNWLTIALPLLKLTAWALTALLAAGVTGILRKT